MAEESIVTSELDSPLVVAESCEAIWKPLVKKGDIVALLVVTTPVVTAVISTAKTVAFE